MARFPIFISSAEASEKALVLFVLTKDIKTFVGCVVGEHMTEVEIVEYLMTLLGYSDNPEVDGSFTADVISALEEIPERVSAPLFAEEIIGLSAQDD